VINQLVKISRFAYCSDYQTTLVAFVVGIALLLDLLFAPPGFCGNKYSQNHPSSADILILQLKDGADQEKFDSLLQEVHCTLIKTLEFGPTLKFLVLQTEPGQAGKIEKRLRSNKDIARVERNIHYRLENIPQTTKVTAKKKSKKTPSGKIIEKKYNKKSPTKHSTSSLSSLTSFSPKVLSSSNTPPPNPIPNDPFLSDQWDLTFMQYQQARVANVMNFNTPVTMIFLDTGLNVISNELATWAVQYDFSDPVNPTGAQEPLLDFGVHGTSTAGVTDWTDNDFGLAGMANWEGNRCFIIECRVCQSQTSGDPIVDVLAALSFIYNSSTISPAPINLSANSPPPNTVNADPMIQQAAQQLRQKGFLLVLSAGNDAANDTSPELYCRRVAGIAQNGTLSSFSDYGPFKAAAPASNINSNCILYPPNYVGMNSGTSFAAPRWCAAIVDVMAALPASKRTAVYADQILFQTATVTTDGWYVPNLQAAMQAAAKVNSN